MSMHLIPNEQIERKIFLIRGKKVMLDYDLADLYNVPTKVLNQTVKRNLKRFPNDFMLRLTKEEVAHSRSQFVTLKRGFNIKYLPFAFTEQGVAMLSSVLNSERAIQVNIQVIRTFTKLREMVLAHKDLAKKIEEMEKKYDHQFIIVFDAIKKLLKIPRKKTSIVKGFTKSS